MAEPAMTVIPKEVNTEKGVPASVRSDQPSIEALQVPSQARQSSRILGLIPPAFFEDRGIERVLPSETNPFDTKAAIQTVILWISINLAAACILIGMLGPVVYELSFVDSCICAMFGSFVGSLAVCYMITWGSKAGLRTMVFSRYVMGWYPQKLVVVLQLLLAVGYNIINCVFAGQALSAVSPNNSLSIVVGIIVVAILSWLITVLGIRVFHYYERYAFIPQIIVLPILYGLAAKHFDLSTASRGDAATVAGNRLSFFSLTLSAAITYSGVGPDYSVYYDPKSPSKKLFLLSYLGLTVSFVFSLILGIGLGSGIASNTAWSTAFETSTGALLVTAFEPAGGFGQFCAVVVALGTVANIIPTAYSTGLDIQLLSRHAIKVPRWVWNTVGAVIYVVCSLAGRERLTEIITNFLALMGYWVAIWIALILEEHLVFKRTRNWDWKAWNDKSKLPLGVAALTAFLLGWIPAILGMAQLWYVGPIASLVGTHGGDMGSLLGFTLASIAYPPLRWLELRIIGR